MLRLFVSGRFSYESWGMILYTYMFPEPSKASWHAWEIKKWRNLYVRVCLSPKNREEEEEEQE